jgi:hypothetical protein
VIVHCRTLWRRVIPPVGGAWIPYTAAQVAARRAAQMVAVVVCTTLPSPADAPAPCDCAPPPIAWQPPPLPVPIREPFIPPVVDVSEPASALLLAVAVVALWWVR